MTAYADPTEDYQTIDRLNVRIAELTAENERLTKKYSKSLEMMADRAEIINQLQAELAAVRAELAECRQAAFENGRDAKAPEYCPKCLNTGYVLSVDAITGTAVECDCEWAQMSEDDYFKAMEEYQRQNGRETERAAGYGELEY